MIIHPSKIVNFINQNKNTQTYQDVLYYYGGLVELLLNGVADAPYPHLWIHTDDAQAFLQPLQDRIKKDAIYAGFSEEEAEYASLFLSFFSGFSESNPLDGLDQNDDLVEWIDCYEF